MNYKSRLISKLIRKIIFDMMSYLLLTFFCAFIQYGNVVYSIQENSNQSTEEVQSEPYENRKFSAILFLAEPCENKETPTVRAANYVDPLKYLNIKEVNRVKKCQSHLESKVGDSYENIIRYNRDSCKCEDLMKNSIKNVVDFCRDDLKMTTAIVTITKDSVDSDIRYENAEMHEAIMKKNSLFSPMAAYGDVQYNNDMNSQKGDNIDTNLPFNNLENTPVPMDNREKGDTSDTNEMAYNMSNITNNTNSDPPAVITGILPATHLGVGDNFILSMPIETPKVPQPQTGYIEKQRQKLQTNKKNQNRFNPLGTQFEVLNLDESDNVRGIEKNSSFFDDLSDINSFSSENEEDSDKQPTFTKVNADDDLFPIFEMFSPPRELAFNNINRWHKRSKVKRDIITQPEHSEWFNFANKNKRQSPNGLINEEKRKQFNPRSKNKSLFDMFNLMEMIRNSLIGDLFIKESGDSENNVDPSLIGKSAEVSMVLSVRNTLNKVKNSPNGFLMIVVGGNLNQIKDPHSSLIQSIKFAAENTDEGKTLLVLTGSCPKEQDATSTPRSEEQPEEVGSPKKRQISIPVFAKGPNVHSLTKCSELYDVPLAIKSYLEQFNGDEAPIPSERRYKRSALRTEKYQIANGSTKLFLYVADFLVVIVLFLTCL